MEELGQSFKQRYLNERKTIKIMKWKVGILCFENPFIKPSSGGKRCILTRIKSLIMIEDVELDIYLFKMPGDNNTNLDDIYKLSNRIKRVFLFDGKSNNPLYILSKYPICNKRRFTNKCVTELNKHEYDYFIYEGEQVAIYRFENAVKSKYHIIYMHDIESEYRKDFAKAQKNWILKIVHNHEAKRFGYIENRINLLFDDVWFISNDELNSFKSKLSSEKGIYIPMPALDIDLFSKKAKSKSVLYVGDLSLKNNFESLVWFTNNVLPEIRQKSNDIEFTVVGKINQNDKEKITGEHISVLGYVDDINALYSNSCCFVCPIIFGAGVKVKTIDALSKGIIVVTNSKGIEGTKLEAGKHLVVCDDSKEMAEIIVDICNDNTKYESIRESGYSFVKENHSLINQANIINLAFEKLSNV